MNAVITECVPFPTTGREQLTTLSAFEVRCCNCGVVVWSSQCFGAGRSVTMDEILFRIETHDCPAPAPSPGLPVGQLPPNPSAVKP